MAIMHLGQTVVRRASIACALVAAGCSHGHTAHVAASSPSATGSINRCTKTPLPGVSFTPPAGLITLSQDPQGTTAGDPGPLQTALQNVVNGGLARIIWHGPDRDHFVNGFLTRNSKGQLLAITAGHAVLDYSNAAQDYRVEDLQGHVSTVKQACFVFETTAHGFIDSTSVRGPVEKDVAVFVLNGAIGTHALTLGSKDPQRGVWYAASCTGNAAAPRTPYQYGVFALGTFSWPNNGPAASFVLSRLEPFREQGDAVDFGAHGASGAVFTTIPQTGVEPVVVGILASGEAVDSVGADQLRTTYGVSVTGARLAPKIDELTPVSVIAQAIRASEAMG